MTELGKLFMTRVISLRENAKLFQFFLKNNSKLSYNCHIIISFDLLIMTLIARFKLSPCVSLNENFSDE